MAKFCKFCGTNNDVTACNCNAQPVQQPAQPQMQQPVQPQMQQPAQPQMQQANYQVNPQQNPQAFNFDAEKANEMMNEAKTIAQSVMNLAKTAATDMIGGIHTMTHGTESMTRAYLLGAHALIAVILSFIGFNNLMSAVSGGYFSASDIPFSTKALAAFFIILITAVYVLIPAGICYGISKSYSPNNTFVDVLGVFSLCTIPTSLLYVVAFAGSFIDGKIAYYIIMAAALVFIIHLYEAVVSVTKQNRNTALLTTVACLVAVAVTEYYLSEFAIEKIVESIW